MSFDSPEIKDGKDLQKNLEKKNMGGKFTEKELINIGELGFDFKKEGDIDSIEAEMKISQRFDKEIQKAWLSSDTPELAEMKQQFDKEIQNTPDVGEKLTLYSSFMESLKGEVGTTIAEEMRNQKDYKKIAEKEVGENKKNTKNHFETMQKLAQDFKKIREDASRERLAKEQKQWEKAKTIWNIEAKSSRESAKNLTYPA